MATIITRPSVEAIGREPFKYYEVLKYMEDHYFRCNSLKELKENERYTVLEEVERVDFGYDEYFLFVKLREYQTGKVVLFDLALLLKTIYIRAKVDRMCNQRYTSDAFINTSLLLKIREAKPYITKMELIDYFKSLVKGKYIYFTFDKVIGLAYYYRAMPHDETLKLQKEHTIYSAHIATL